METGVVEATSVLVRGVPRNFLGVGVQKFLCYYDDDDDVL